MKIGIDASSAVSDRWGGPENYSYYLIQALAKVDQENQYRLYINREPPRKLPETDNFEICLFKMPRLWTHGGLSWHSFSDPIDLLFSPAHALPLITRPGLPTIFTVHDLASRLFRQYYDLPGRLYLNYVTAYSARKASQVLAVSASTKRDLIEELGLPERKVTVVHNGYNSERFYPALPEDINRVLRKFNIKKPYFLAVGTVQPRKNYTRLIEAFSRVLGSSSPALRGRFSGLSLVISGKPGWQCEDIYSAPAKYGIRDQVFFLGHIPDEDLTLLMSGSLALLYPSLYEGFGLAALEAMACGTLVLASNNSSLPEAVGEIGILIDPHSADSIAEGILRILEMSLSERTVLVNKGLQRVKGFTWEISAEKTLQVFQSVCYDEKRRK